MKEKRRYAHLSTRYVVDRVMQVWWMRANPIAPWLSRQAVVFIEQWLQSGDSAIEWGSGRSTTWLASRVERLRSVEHNPVWHQVVTQTINQNGVGNVDCLLIEQTEDISTFAMKYSHDSLADIAQSSLDFALVDGIFRDHCALAVLEKLKPGGLLVIDDAHRYLPSSSRSPSSIPAGGRCASETWVEFLEKADGWRRTQFSDGVKDDVLFFKPPDR